MKRTKTSKTQKTSPYYASILRIIAVATLVVVSTVIASAIYAPFAYNWTETNLMTSLWTWSSLTAGAITLGGGFGISLLASRKTAASRDERIVKAGAFGSLAYLVYTVTFGLLLLLDAQTTGTVRVSLTPFGPVLALLIVTAAAIFDRRSVPFLRGIMGTFVVAFVATEIFSTLQAYRFIGSSRGAMAGSVAVWFEPLLYLLIPGIVIAALFFSLRRIGRITRLFYPAYVYSLAFNLTLALSSLYWNPEEGAATAFQNVVAVITLGFVVAILAAFVRARRLKR